jgi:hypothetical protein
MGLSLYVDRTKLGQESECLWEKVILVKIALDFYSNLCHSWRSKMLTTFILLALKEKIQKGSRKQMLEVSKTVKQ